MKKEIIKRESSEHDAQAQIDSVLSQIGAALRSGNWTATLEHTYDAAGAVLLTRIVTIEHKAAAPPPTP